MRVNVYLPALSEMRREARRQGRSLSWLLRRAWIIARGRIARPVPGPEWERVPDAWPDADPAEPMGVV